MLYRLGHKSQTWPLALQIVVGLLLGRLVLMLAFALFGVLLCLIQAPACTWNWWDWVDYACASPSLLSPSETGMPTELSAGPLDLDYSGGLRVGFRGPRP